MVGFSFYSNQGTIEGFAVLGHVLIVELLIPQADETLFHLLLAGAYGVVSTVCAGNHT